MTSDIIYNIQHAPYWNWKVALDLFFGGAGVGALLFAIGVDERFHGKYKRICHTAAWLAPILVGMGLTLVLLKMGRPFRTYQAYLNVNLTSPLWWGGIFQPLLVLGALVYAWRWNGKRDTDPFRLKLGRLLVPLALIVGTYHGLLLAVNVSHPLWSAGPTVVSSLLGFASTGIAAVMLVHLIRMKVAGRLSDPAHVGEFLDDLVVVRNLLVGVLAVQLFTYFLWWLELRAGTEAAQRALAAANGSYGPLLWGVSIGLGIVVPMLLGALALVRGEKSHRSFQVTTIFVTSLLILVGGACFRLAVVLGGQVQVPPQLF